jgi:hypothetical protein
MALASNTDSNDISVVNCNDICEKQQIVWASIARDNEILVQTGHIAASKLAQQLLLKQETPGFEYHTLDESPLPEWQAQVPSDAQQPTRHLKGIKFHLYESSGGITKADSVSVKTLRVWVYCAVYDSSVMSLKTVKAFVGKIIEKTQLQRLRYNMDGCQDIFRPVLFKEMQAISSMSKREVRRYLDTIRDLVRANVEILLAASPSEDDSNSLREAHYHQMIRTAQYGAVPIELSSGML